MQFEGKQLLEVIARTKTLIAVMNSCNQVEEEGIDAERCARICSLDGYVGIGHMKRIRYIRPLRSAYLSPMAQGNHTTRRIRNDQNVIIAPKPMVEHRIPTPAHTFSQQ